MAVVLLLVVGIGTAYWLVGSRTSDLRADTMFGWSMTAVPATDDFPGQVVIASSGGNDVLDPRPFRVTFFRDTETLSRLELVDGRRSGSPLAHTLLTIPDWDGDGVADVVIGSSTWSSTSHADCGAVFVVSSADGSLLASWEGSASETGIGRPIALVGDVDGDEKPDFAVLERGGHYNAPMPAPVLVVLGSRDQDRRLEIDLSRHGIKDVFSSDLVGVTATDEHDAGLALYSDNDDDGVAIAFDVMTGEVAWRQNGSAESPISGWVVAHRSVQHGQTLLLAREIDWDVEDLREGTTFRQPTRHRFLPVNPATGEDLEAAGNPAIETRYRGVHSVALGGDGETLVVEDWIGTCEQCGGGHLRLDLRTLEEARETTIVRCGSTAEFAGQVVAIADRDGDGRPDLAISDPGRGLGEDVEDAGAVEVFSSATGKLLGEFRRTRPGRRIGSWESWPVISIHER